MEMDELLANIETARSKALADRDAFQASAKKLIEEGKTYDSIAQGIQAAASDAVADALAIILGKEPGPVGDLSDVRR